MRLRFTQLLAALLVMASGTLLAEPLLNGQPCRSTPYDAHLSNVKAVLKNLNGSKPNYEQVIALMKQGQSFRYVRSGSPDAATPAETAERAAGDCKAKALWLASQLGDKNVRYVIGWTNMERNVQHAWLTWESDNQLWILDPTLSSQPISAASVGMDEYIAAYSFGQKGAYYHSMTEHLQNTLAGFKINSASVTSSLASR